MSDTLDNTPEGVQVGAYCGPADEGADRQRWQLWSDGAILHRDEVLVLAAALIISVAERPAVKP